MKKVFYGCCLLLLHLSVNNVLAQTPDYLNARLPISTRVHDLVSRLTLQEKVQQMMNSSPAIPRLNIPAYNWWNEALHGVARSGVATVFPQAIGMAATFNDSLAFVEASAISDEARAMYNAAVKRGIHEQYGGLTFWTPNINIFRDPRWGRGQETYGEDPTLTKTMGVAFVKGLQGDDPRYLKVAACAKHFAVHSGPERLRHSFNAVASIKDLRETYLPAFKALVKDAHVEAVMCAYNSTNGEPCCANTFLLDDILRNEWHFKGHVVSDCGAIGDIYEGHHYVKTAAEAAALSVKKGVSLDCGVEYTALIDAVKQNLISEKTIDSALVELLATRFKLGMFDNVNDNPYNQIPESVINSPQHRALAKEVAVQSAVLLKNNGVLPLKNNLPRYFITGPNASNVDVLLGNYYGVNNRLVTFLEGFAGHIAPGSQLQYKMGSLLDRPDANPIDWTSGDAKNSDVTIAVLGLSGLLEGEEGESIASTTYGDRLNYNIPQNQIDFLKKLREGNKKPIIAIITGGSPMNLSEVHELADAVLLVWYPGEEGGNAAADIVFGKANPSGKLPVTFPMSYDQLPPYEDYNMQGRTYRFMKGTPMYPFGFGLSYNTYSYTNPVVSKSIIKNGDSINCAVTINNNGKYDGLEAVQLYVQHENAPANAPIYALKAFKKVAIPAQGTSTVSFTITPDMLQLVNDKGESYLPKGKINIYVGGSLPDKRSIELGASKPAMITVESK